MNNRIGSGTKLHKTVKPPRFYGWTIAGVVSLLVFVGGVETNPVLGVIQGPITEEFGWSRATFTLPMAIGTFAGGIAAVFMGPIMDRRGSRGVMTVAVAMMGTLFVAMSLMQSLWQFFILQILGRTLVASTFFIVVGVVIPKWFITKRGRAVGLSSLGLRFGHAVYPIVVGLVMAVAGWRAASMALGISVWVLALGPTIALLKRRPEDIGQFPDGRTRDLRVQESSTSPSVSEISFTRKEALRTRAFYYLLGALAIQMFVATGINFHWYSYLIGNGVTPSATVTSLAIAPLVGMPATIVTGYAVEKVPPRLVLAFGSLLCAMSLALFLFADNSLMAIAFGVSYGIAIGMRLTTNQVIWADYFGRNSSGAIQGLISPVQMFTNALGPFAAALWFDVTGSYKGIFVAGIGLLLVSAALSALARKPSAAQ